MSESLLLESIESKIFIIRGKKVMLDRDLASLYGVATKVLNQAVQRNLKRFPLDFMFKLNTTEAENLRSQIVTSSWGGQRYLPYTFTEQGVAMLSSVLQSDQAIEVNIQIMRTFTKLREMLMQNHELKAKIETMERNYDSQFKNVFEAIKLLINNDQVIQRQLSETEEKQHNKQFGFKPNKQ